MVGKNSCLETQWAVSPLVALPQLLAACPEGQGANRKKNHKAFSHAVLSSDREENPTSPCTVPYVELTRSIFTRLHKKRPWNTAPNTISLDEKLQCGCKLYNSHLPQRELQRNPSSVFYPLKQTWFTKHRCSEKGGCKNISPVKSILFVQ